MKIFEAKIYPQKHENCDKLTRHFATLLKWLAIHCDAMSSGFLLHLLKLLSMVFFQMSSQIACLRGCIATLAAFV